MKNIHLYVISVNYPDGINNSKQIYRIYQDLFFRNFYYHIFLVSSYYIAYFRLFHIYLIINLCVYPFRVQYQKSNCINIVFVHISTPFQFKLYLSLPIVGSVTAPSTVCIKIRHTRFYTSVD